MNMQQKNALQEGSPEREDAVYNLARTRMREDPEWQPVRLELKNTYQSQYNISGHDGFDIVMKEDTHGGRIREMRELTIVDKFQHFVEHPDYAGLIKVIPATQHNLRLMASHVPDDIWHIHDDDIREKVEAYFEEMKASKNKPAVIRPDIEPKADIVEIAPSTATAEAPKEAAVRETEDDDDDPDGGEDEYEAPAPQAPQESDEENEKRLVEMARKAVIQRHRAEIEEMKAKGQKGIHFTSQYRGWMDEELERLKATGA